MQNKSRKIKANSPIGVFDSGLGGLTVVRELAEKLPGERIIYFGDIARLPYGIKSDEQIREFSHQNTEFLVRHHVKAIVIACNSSSSAAFSFLAGRYQLPIIDVIGPAAEDAAARTRNQRIGVIGTQATIEGGAYQRRIEEIHPNIRVYSQACPLLVSLVEEGSLKGQITQLILKRYITPLLKKKIDTLILGCTHYPLLKREIQKVVGRDVVLVDSAPATVKRLRAVLGNVGLLNKSKSNGQLDVYVSDVSRNFIPVASHFLGKSLDNVHVVRMKNEITVNGMWV